MGDRYLDVWPPSDREGDTASADLQELQDLGVRSPAPGLQGFSDSPGSGAVDSQTVLYRSERRGARKIPLTKARFKPIENLSRLVCCQAREALRERVDRQNSVKNSVRRRATVPTTCARSRNWLLRSQEVSETRRQA